jgi:hypothetical protein
MSFFLHVIWITLFGQRETYIKPGNNPPLVFGSVGRSAVDTRTLISSTHCLQEISKDLEGEVAVLDRIQKTCGLGPSIEETLEATKPATRAGRARIDGEHYNGPTSMERLQAHHDRMDKLAFVHTRAPEQIILDAALAVERLQHEGGDDVTD